MTFVWSTAHSHIHFTFSTFERELGKWRGTILCGTRRLVNIDFQDFGAETIWTCSLVLVQSPQLPLHLTATDRQVGGVGDNDGAAVRSVTEVEDETAEM